MSKSLFKDFEGVSSKAWKQKIQVDLKGADYNDTLIWNTNEGIDVKPYYHSDDFDVLPEPSHTKGTKWKIAQAIEVDNAENANKKAIDAIERGAESIQFLIKHQDILVNDLLKNIDLEKIPVDIKCDFLSEEFVSKFDNVLNNSGNNNLMIHCDIIGNLAKSGNWYKNLKDDHTALEAITNKTNQLSVNLSLYQNAGANMVQQLAYGLAHVNEYLNHFDDKLNDQSKLTLEVIFNVTVGSNYFFEIAKLRALRQLWATLATQYGINEECKINVTPSKRNKTIYDYNVNMLRTTTECMSAVLGGADIVCNLPYDALYHEANEFGDRISRNQLLVLKNESYFDKVNNPTDGAYYIEQLTEQIAEKALEIFKGIEANGGFLKQLKEGTIQRKIKENSAKEQADFDAQKIVLLGTNKHPNSADKMKNELEKSPFIEKIKRKTLIEPVIEKRLSESLDINRLKEE